jgi:pentapeptide MXKDX repeat protein
MLMRMLTALIFATALAGGSVVRPVFAQDGQNMQGGMMGKSTMKDEKMKQDKMKDDKMSRHKKKAKHRSSRKPKTVQMSGDKM